MKIYYCVRSINHVPSCIYNIRMINDLEYEVVPVIGDLSDEMKKLFGTLKMNIITNDNNAGENQKSAFRISKLYMSAIRKMNKLVQKDDIVFFGTVDSAIHALPVFKKHKYVLCVKEMYDTSPLGYKLLTKYVSKKASAVICCEKNRAIYAKYMWDLKQMPYVLSNKPYGHPRMRNLKPSSPKIAEVLEKMEGQKSIVYQAKHMWYGTEIAELAKGLKMAEDKNYQLVIIGQVDDESLKDKIKAIYSNVVWAGHVYAPLHLEITSHAQIGIAVYSQSCLNNLFCAPNKTYEYAGFGIPILCNDVPGLIGTVGISRAGLCIEWKAENIADAINKMFDDYEIYSENAKKFFEDEDNVKKIGQIIEDIRQRW